MAAWRLGGAFDVADTNGKLTTRHFALTDDEEDDKIRETAKTIRQARPKWSQGERLVFLSNAPLLSACWLCVWEGELFCVGALSVGSWNFYRVGLSSQGHTQGLRYNSPSTGIKLRQNSFIFPLCHWNSMAVEVYCLAWCLKKNDALVNGFLYCHCRILNLSIDLQGDFHDRFGLIVPCQAGCCQSFPIRRAGQLSRCELHRRRRRRSQKSRSKNVQSTQRA